MHGDADLPGAGAHHPQVAGEEPRIVARSRGAIGDRRELGAGAGQRQRHDANLADIVAGGQHFDVGDAGDDRAAAGP